MSSIQKVKRTVKSKRSRNGCAFCKEKRLKCDETRPACQNCVTRQRVCPGYKPVLKWRTTQWQGETSEITFSGRKKSATPTSPQKPATTVDKTASDMHAESTTSESGLNATNTPEHIKTPEPGHAEEPQMVTVDNAVEWSHLSPTNRSQTEDFDSLMEMKDYDGLEVASVAHGQQAVDLDGLTIDQLLDSAQQLHAPSNLLTPSAHPRIWEAGQSPISGSLFGDISGGSDNCLTTTRTHASRDKRRDVRKLLTRFYTTQPKLTYPLFHQGTKLVEHYFSTICAVYSCYDSFMNPFRSVVSQQWNNSASTYYAIQSMAAAHLANELPFMKKEGLELHRQASEHLGKELCSLQSTGSVNDQPLLTLLLLGMSACWQRPGDLGLPYLRTARSFLRSNLRKANSSVSRPLLQLFEEAMVYWEMVTSFVASDSDIDILQAEKLSQMNEIAQTDDATDATDASDTTGIVPHPWTGISPESQILLGQVGKVVYAARTQHPLAKNYADCVSVALNLEESLLDLTFPESSSMLYCGDGSTKPSDFITLAETTRDAGLLELYRAFPALLQRRLPTDTSIDTPNFFEDIAANPYPERRSWLTSLALHILKRLESIPASSHVRVHQLLLIVIAASELRFPARSKDASISLSFSEDDAEIYQARKFTRARLHQLAGQLPAQPVHVILELLTEVWSRLDSRPDDDGEGIFWIDVMVEKGWHTLMG